MENDCVHVYASSNVTEQNLVTKEILENPNYKRNLLKVNITLQYTSPKPSPVFSRKPFISERNVSTIIPPKISKYINAITNKHLNDNGNNEVRVDSNQILQIPVFF